MRVTSRPSRIYSGRGGSGTGHIRLMEGGGERKVRRGAESVDKGEDGREGELVESGARRSVQTKR